MHFHWTSAWCLTPWLVTSLLVAPGEASYRITKPELETRDLHTFYARALPEMEGFDDKNPADQTKIKRIVQGFKDMTTMVRRVLAASEVSDANAKDRKTWETVLANYFHPEQDAIVIEELQAMVDPCHKDPDTGSDMIMGIEVNNQDFENNCDTLASRATKPLEKGSAGAYTNTQGFSSTIHFCATDYLNVYNYPDLSDLPTTKDQCVKTFGTKVSAAMAPFAYIVTHEITHTQIISSGALKTAGSPIAYTDDPAYGPQKARQLTGDLLPGIGVGKSKMLGPVENADSYAWFIVELYWTLICDMAFEAPTSNENAPSGICVDLNNCKKKSWWIW